MEPARYDKGPDVISNLLPVYGPWLVFAVVALESAGIPLPGETTLIGGAVLASVNPELSIATIVVAAACGAIAGDNLGYWAGRHFGAPLLRRYGHYLHLDRQRLNLLHYLFNRYGGWVVFFGRFVALLRAVAAMLAGANGMKWGRFFIFNAAGAVCWSAFFGFGAYELGSKASESASVLTVLFLAIAVIAGLLLVKLFFRYEIRLQRDARPIEEK